MIVLAASVVAYLISSSRGPEPGPEVTTESGLKMQDLRVGDGVSPKPGQTITVHYVGTLDNGKEFDSSYKNGKPVDFRIGVGAVIKGWEEGVATMKVGGKRRLVVPPELGYGANPRSNIPPNSRLNFEVELLDVK